MNTVPMSSPSLPEAIDLEQSARRSEVSLKIFLLLHIPLALALRVAPTFSTVHALTVLGIGLVFAVFNRQLDIPMAVCAYITGAEVLWRMTGASVFYEFGKYAVILVMLLALWRQGKLRSSLLLVLYLLALVPGAVLSFSSPEVRDPIGELSFNLSGPLALVVCCSFFRQASLSPRQWTRLALMLMAPVISIATIVSVSAFFSGSIQFSHNSNFTASGGFGPNQVSAALGLGMLIAVSVMLREPRWRAISFALLLLFGVQSAMTFSRTGLYSFAASFLVLLFFVARNAQVRFQAAVGVALLALIVNFAILPSLDTYTDGELSNRFQKTDSTGRDILLLSDLEIWEENPVLGAGVGSSTVLHKARLKKEVATHTEFTRLLAEHGTLGLFALMIFLGMAVAAVRRQQSVWGKGLAASLFVWTLLFMTASAMRLVAPAFVYGLMFAGLIVEGEEEETPPTAILPRDTNDEWLRRQA